MYPFPVLRLASTSLPVPKSGRRGRFGFSDDDGNAQVTVVMEVMGWDGSDGMSDHHG